MQRVEVSAGVCGFTTVITARLQDGQVALDLESDCERIRQVAARLEAVDPIAELYGGAGASQIRACCNASHATCVVPVAALKAVEAEAGLALPRDAGLRFIG